MDISERKKPIVFVNSCTLASLIYEDIGYTNRFTYKRCIEHIRTYTTA